MGALDAGENIADVVRPRCHVWIKPFDRVKPNGRQVTHYRETAVPQHADGTIDPHPLRRWVACRNFGSNQRTGCGVAKQRPMKIHSRPYNTRSFQPAKVSAMILIRIEGM